MYWEKALPLSTKTLNEKQVMQLYTQQFTVITRGRGKSFNRNIRNIHDTEEGVAFEVYGEKEECLLAVHEQSDGMKLPYLLYADGTGGVALYFETQNEKGEWKAFDLTSVVK